MNCALIAICVCLVQYCAAQGTTAKSAGPQDFRLLINQAEIEVSPRKNVVLSPNNILHTMVGAYLLSAQNTEKEIRDAIGLTVPTYKLHSDELPKSREYHENSTFYTDPKITPKIKGEEIDFVNQNSPNTINKWISEQTGKRIRKFYNGPFDPKVGAVTVSANYIESFWKEPQTITKKGPFYNGKQVIEVDFMEHDSIIPYYSTDKFQSFGIPFEKRGQYLFIILPHKDETLADLNDKLTTKDYYDVFKNSQRTQVLYAIPKLNLKSRQNLKNALQVLGVVRSFMPGVANFSELTDYEVNVDNITYESVLNLYESGIDAASAITMEMVQSSLISHPEPPVLPEEVVVQSNSVAKTGLPLPQQITVNRPFIFILYDDNQRVNLMSGAVYNPQPLYKIN